MRFVCIYIVKLHYLLFRILCLGINKFINIITLTIFSCKYHTKQKPNQLPNAIRSSAGQLIVKDLCGGFMSFAAFLKMKCLALSETASFKKLSIG
jgi:hypothetical protein